MKSRSTAVACAALLLAGTALVAQIESGDRGIAPLDSSSSYEVNGVSVDISGKTAEAARLAGWREAQRRGWKMLYAKTHGGDLSEAPTLPDSTLDAIVSGIIVESEQIGPTRYIAQLGVLFDKSRAGSLLGVQGQVTRSAPMLVIPVMISGGTPTSLEVRNEWQRAWARFRTGNSAIDYVRPTGSGIDPLLLNAAQANRPGRGQWRLLLDLYGASDIVVPEVRVRRLWPGGPAIGEFIARHGPDGEIIDRFTLRVPNSAGLPKLMDAGVARIDAAYTRALGEGRMTSDPSLIIEVPEVVIEVEEVEEKPVDRPAANDVRAAIPDPSRPAAFTAVTIRVETPTAGSVDAAEAAARGVGGVGSATVTSLAVGGTSLMRIIYSGDVAALRASLAARGWVLEGEGSALRMRRAGSDGAEP